MRDAVFDVSVHRAIEVDGALVARGLGLEVVLFRQLMDARRIVLLCERGTGADAGYHRATFYHHDRRVRLLLDPQGRVVAQE